MARFRLMTLGSVKSYRRGAGYSVTSTGLIVRSRDGVPLTNAQWRATVKASRKYDIGLIADGATTAVRCEAPFACHLPNYQRYGRPDLISFGKGV